MEDLKVEASAGSDDGLKVFLNGEEVHDSNKKRSFKSDEDLFEMNLQEGKNHLLLKITRSGGDWRFTFKLPGKRVTNNKNRYYIVE